MVKLRRVIKQSAFALLALVLLFSILERVREVFACQYTLAALKANVMSYRLEHNGLYPTNIIAVATASYRFQIPNTTSMVNILSCPGVRKRSLTVTNTAIESDYVYINWTPFFGTNAVPDGYPLMYDRHLSNHAGFGINILPVNGVIFWDLRARWLKDFAAKHPEYHVPLPE